MKSVLYFAMLCLAFARTKWHQLDNYNFDQYMTEFGKTYSQEERSLRSSLFESRIAEIRRHNQVASATYKKGVSQYTDWTEEERSRLLGLDRALLFNEDHSRANKPSDYADVKLQTSVDWRAAGIVSAVKDQGACGSCWTFGTTETIESYMALANGMLTDLSEQEILDCTANPNQCGGTGGCGGGTAVLAMEQIMTLGGQTTEWMYPYVSYQGVNQPKCLYNSATTRPLAVLSGYTLLTPNEESQMMAHLSSTGPLIVNVDASSWFDYESGVYNGCNQTNPSIDHVVQLVGYGTDIQLGDYWIVRNSWSPTWGELGYVRLLRSNKLQCGVDLDPSEGSACNNGPKDVKVCGTCGIAFHVAYPNVQQ